MGALIDVILPVFLVIGFGYAATWWGLFTEAWIDGLMRFAQNIAIPCLLFRAIATLDLGTEFSPALLGSFYLGATISFVVGIVGARLVFARPWEDSVAIGFCCLFSNSLLLGLPITERAYGPDALASNYAIISIHAPFGYLLGIGVMEIVRNAGRGFWSAIVGIFRTLAQNPLVIGIAIGFVVNLTALPLPGVLTDALDLLIRAAIPTALFGLGGVLYRYRPEGDLRTIAFVISISLVLHPALVWFLGKSTGLTTDQFRSAILTAASAPGVNAYLFANMYGVAKRVAASSVLLGTATMILSGWLWLSILS